MLLLASLIAAFAAAPKPAPPAPPPSWDATIEQVSLGVVALRVDATRPFDTEGPGSSVGTGFVVDKENGIILTNRHMVHTGPVKAEAVFLDHEEVALQPIYRDPVHDFGFYKFDPKDVRFQEIHEIPLFPAGAKVGTEIRVIGNDAGEKLSILDGTIARLDREAPGYGDQTYNDFNTFYIQAASATSGGSSGSPVVDILGRAIALNAGGKRTSSSSYYLPLDRVVRALELVRLGQAVPRGGLQAIFRQLPFDELRRLGLRPESEAEARRRFPEGTGLLVVSEVVPEGPAWGRLRPGDVLLSVDGAPLDVFVSLEAALDAKVGGVVRLGIERGGASLEIEVTVEDQHATSPDAYLEVAGAVLTDLSFQQARNNTVPARGVYVSSSGYSFSLAGVPGGAVITAVDGVAVATLEEAEKALAPVAHNTRITVRYFPITDPRHEQVAVVRLDRLWFGMQRCERDAQGDWPCTASAAPGAPRPAAPAGAAPSPEGPRLARQLATALVDVECEIPYRTAGAYSSSFRGTGLIIDAEQGLVLVDRDTVPVLLAEVELTFGGVLRLRARVERMHPEHGIAILRYDPAALGELPVSAVELRASELRPGDELFLVGLDGAGRLVHREVSLGEERPVELPLPGIPAFREINREGFELIDAPSTMGGALVDRRGRMVAWWCSFAVFNDGRSAFFRAIPTARLLPPLRAPEQERTLGVEWSTRSLAEARDRGLNGDLADTIARAEPRAQLLAVRRVDPGSPSAGLLRGGDVLLTVDGAPTTRFHQVEAAIAGKEEVALQVLRDGKVERLALPTRPLQGGVVDRVLVWAGMVLHAPNLDYRFQRGLPGEGVLVSTLFAGSPAQRYGLRATLRIVEVDGKPTPDLDSFAAAVAGRADRSPVRLRVVDMDDRESVKTLKLDLAFWPGAEFVYGAEGWSRR